MFLGTRSVRCDVRRSGLFCMWLSGWFKCACWCFVGGAQDLGISRTLCSDKRPSIGGPVRCCCWGLHFWGSALICLHLFRFCSL